MRDELKSRDAAIEKLKRKAARIGVVGLGYAGLPLALTFAEAGFETVGLDIDRGKIEKLNRGESYVCHLPAQRLGSLVSSGRLRATDDWSVLAQCDAVIICVPTPLGPGHTPDLAAVETAARSVAAHLHRGQLVVLESTTYPGTTDELVLGILARPGLEVGEDFFLAFSPEREDPGNAVFHTKNIPKVVGGVTPACLAVASAAYGAVIEQVVAVSSARVAETVKLLENIYRCVNVALVNELKLLLERMGIDVWEVIAAAATKPFGFTAFYPGPGLGGHCIPIDPFYLSWRARQYGLVTRFIELAGEINSSLPDHVVDRVGEGLNLMGKPLNGAAVLLLGVAYKRDVDDTRESPALRIIGQLEHRLARVTYHDPHVPALRSSKLARVMSSVELTPETVDSADVVVIVTDHSSVDYAMVLDHAKLIVDTRNATHRWRNESHKVLLA